MEASKEQSKRGSDQDKGSRKKSKKEKEPPQEESCCKTPKRSSQGQGRRETVEGGVIIEDLKIGNGPVAEPGKKLAMYYVGRLKESNKQFDAQISGPGLKFTLGSRDVIAGWDVGVLGMRVGGKRLITCPPAMAYGKEGYPPVIPPNSTLVFEVELISVK